jgi:hypothetical protein
MKENFFNEDCKTCFAKKRCASEWTEGCQDYQRYKRKQEILQDICCRIPYKVRTVYNGEMYEILGISHGRCTLCKPFRSEIKEFPLVEEIKPYLYPLSSMEELGLLEEYNHIVMGFNNEDVISVNYIKQLLDFYHCNHLDYNGLIPMGLAINATGRNIY